MNLEKRTVRNTVWWIAGAILLPLLLFLALGAQDQIVSYSVFKVPAVSAYYFIYYAEKWFGVFHLFLTAAAILVAIVIAVRISDRSIYVIILGISEPPVRTLRATIPENERHIFR